jgi:hypothetical protein
MNYHRDQSLRDQIHSNVVSDQNPFEHKDKPSYRVTGVVYKQNNQYRTVLLEVPPILPGSIASSTSHSNGITPTSLGLGLPASRGILLASGAIMTPKLLMISGIGPKEVLRESNIDVLIDNPNVGKNLRDHPTVGISAYLSDTAIIGKSDNLLLTDQPYVKLSFLLNHKLLCAEKPLAQPYAIGLSIGCPVLYDLPAACDHYVQSVKQHQSHPFIRPSPILSTINFNSYAYDQQGPHYDTVIPDAIKKSNASRFKTNFGVLASTGFSAGAFLKSPFQTSDEPDLQVIIYPRVNFLIRNIFMDFFLNTSHVVAGNGSALFSTSRAFEK